MNNERLMGLDFGSKTVGVALSDPTGLIASPLEIIEREREDKLRKTFSRIEELIEDADMVLIMTVNPGYGGQKFIESQLGKIHILYHMIDEMETECNIEVDGGINAATSELVRKNGANILVAGSAIYGAEDVAQAIEDIRGKEIVHHHHHDEDEEDDDE